MQKKALEISNLSKFYKDGTQALDSVNFSVKEGDFFALLGPNGAGKSTIIGILTSLVRKNTGIIKIFGVDIDKNFAKAKSFIGVVPQEFNFNIFETPLQILVNQAGYYGIPAKKAIKRAEALLKRLDLFGKKNCQAGELSGGMKRRLMLARGLVHHPKLLILDEPTAGVDIELRRDMWDFLTDLNKNGVTIILTTHYFEEAEILCRNVAIINHGCIVENTSMKSVFARFNRQTFTLELQSPVKDLNQLAHKNITSIDDTTLEVDCFGDTDLNQIFLFLEKCEIKVKNLKNKVNRLEELFVQVVKREK